MRRSHLAPLICALMLVGCGRDTNGPSRGQVPATDTVAGRRHEAGPDAELSTSIRRAILDDEELSPMAKRVNVASEDGVVTLHGRVSSPAEKQAVAAIARGARGVRRVDDQLGVILR